MADIHPLAAVSPDAELGRDVSVGPFCVIESGVRIGDGCRLASHVVVHRDTTLGANNQIFEGAIVGGVPQHVQVPPVIGRLVIGDDNIIREHVTIHRAMKEDAATRIGNQNFLMVGAHVAHDCVLGNNIIIANGTGLCGHVTIEDRAFLSGMVGIHQFCRVGRLAMVGGMARVTRDVPPFVMIDGSTDSVVGINRVGLRRAGFTVQEINQLKEAYRLIYRSGLPWNSILERLQTEFSEGVAGCYYPFFQEGRRGFVQERRDRNAVKLPTDKCVNEDGSCGSKQLRKAG